MMSYEGTLETLVARIEALIPAHPEIMYLDSAWALLKVDGFECADLEPSLAQAASALNEAKKRYRSKNKGAWKGAWIDELRARRRALARQIDAIDEEAQRLELELCRAKHPCSCVRLNRDIGVVDHKTAAEKHRSDGFGLGFIGALLSADRHCEQCRGTGVPKEER